VLDILEDAYRNIGRKMGNVYPPPPIQVIVYDADQFAEATQLASHVGAVYDGKIRVPLKGEDGAFLSDEELRRRLYHEYVHVVIRHVAGDNVPWWLNEGLAETFSSDVSQKHAARLQHLYDQGQDFKLAELDASQLRKRDADSLRLAYLQSHATVDLLWRRFGRGRLSGMLSDLKEGMAPEQALRRNYRRSYTMLENEVANSYR